MSHGAVRTADREGAPLHDPALRRPVVGDAAAMWDIARSNDLDLNSAYYYLAFCRDFAGTSIVATLGGEPVGFVTGYRRPDEPSTLFVWQVAVDRAARRRGLGLAMLCGLRDRLVPGGVRHLEATVTPSNGASAALFRSLARSSGSPIGERTLFGADCFPRGQDHEAEVLVRIGPFGDGGG